MPLPEALRALHARARDAVTGKPLLTEAEFAARVDGLRGEFAGLLDDEALGLLVLDELGCNEGAVITLRECPGRAEATVRVRVERIEGVRTFTNERGEGRVGNVLVSDPTGEARLVLWGRDVRKLDDRELKEGDLVRVVNARIKDSRFGLELHAGQWTALEVEGALDPAKRKLLADVATEGEAAERAPRLEGGDAAADAPARVGAPSSSRTPGPRPPDAGSPSPGTPTARAPLPRVTSLPASPRQSTLMDASATTRLADVTPASFAVTVEARVARVGSSRIFQRRDGSTGFVVEARIEDDSGSRILTAWDEAVKAVITWSPGDRVRIVDASVKERFGEAQLHTTPRTRLERAVETTVSPKADPVLREPQP